jgi:hypothetical protein
MASITTRASKGSALTWTEADNNITNLNTAKIENVVEDLTPQLGGALDVNGKVITNTLAGSATSIDITTKDIKLIPGVPTIGSDGKVSINNAYFLPNSDGTNGQVLGTDGAGTVNFKTVNTDVVYDTTPQLGGNLDVNGQSIVSASNGNINITPNGSGNIALTPTTGKIILGALDFPTGMGTNGQVLTTNGSSALSFTTISAGATTLDGLSDVVITAAATNDVLVYNGTNWVDTAAGSLTVSAAATATGATSINISTIDGNTSDTTLYPVLVGVASTGNQLPHIDSGALTFNASTNILSSTGFAGALNGTVGATTPSTGVFTGLTGKGATNSAKLTLDTTAVSSTAWGVNGIGLSSLSATYTDTSSTGTVSDTAIHSILAPTIASTNTTTRTNAYTLLVNGAPVAGANTTITNSFAIWASGTVRASQFQGAIGTTTPSTGAFVTLSATGAVTLSPANLAVAISPTGTGTVTISPATAGTINNMSIGATTASTGRFTTVTSTATTGTAPFTVASTTNVTNLNASSLNGATFAAPGAIGSTTASTGAFTTLSASGVATLGGTTFPSATGSTGQVLALSSAGVAAWTTSSGSAPSITDDTASATTHYLIIDDATSGALGPKTSSTKLTFVPSTGILTATGFAGPHNGTVGATTASTGAFTTLSASSTVSGTGFSTYLASPPAIGGTARAAGSFTTMTADTAVLDDIRETVAALTYGATITPNAADGSIRTITLTGNVTFSAFTSPVSGQSITLIITQDATGSRTLTSTMKFAGGLKTLTTTANAIDILTVSYIGTTYYASLSKGFA